MLVQFAVTNYRSFRGTTVLSLVPAPGVAHHPGQTVSTGNPKVPELLRAAVVYGPNAAGKSNLVKAIEEVLRLLRDEVPRPRPFRLAAEGGASRFELDVVLDGELWSYGIQLGPRGVEEEWLARTDVEPEQVAFHRAQGEAWEDAVQVPADIAPAVVALARNVPNDRAFVQVCAAAGLGVMKRLGEWADIRVWSVEDFTGWWHTPLIAWDAVRVHAEGLLRRAGAGEVDIRFVADGGDEDLSSALTEVGGTVGSLLTPEQARELPEQFHHRLAVRLMRAGAGGTHVAFDLDEESDGTRRLLELSAWHHMTARGATIGIVDELERSLHPLVVRMLLEGLLDPKARGQLVCTTHDSNLLDRTLLPADSIWFAQKGPDGATQLYSLAEFKPDQLDQLAGHLEEGYLEGRFGAIPFLADPARLGWKQAR